MKLALLLFFAAAAVCACTLLLLILRARERRLLAAAARAAYSDAPDGIGISVLCSGVTDPANSKICFRPNIPVMRWSRCSTPGARLPSSAPWPPATA